MNIIIKCNLFILASLFVLNAYGQRIDYRDRPRECNPSLKSLFNGYEMELLTLSGHGQVECWLIFLPQC